MLRTDDPRAIKVVLKDREGRFLSGHKQAWLFTEDAEQAVVFDFVGDRITEQLRELQEHGLSLTAVPVEPRERYEICDGCGNRAMAMKTYFDGQKFLCATCRQKLTAQKIPAAE